jgi:3-methyladenine DNA glycosylase AlkD
MDELRLSFDVIDELRDAAEPAYRESALRYISARPVDQLLGVRTANTRAIAAKHFPSLKPLGMPERLAACDALIATRLFEARIVAFDWAYRSRCLFEPQHLKHFYYWLAGYVDDWNDCDDLCGHAIGEFFLRFPDRADETGTWAHSKNRWVQRGAAVSFIPLVREGRQLDQAFAVADALLTTEDDLVQKAYGWLLKEATRHFQPQVFDFIMQRKGNMPRTALRYAIEKMPPAMKQQAMM